MALLPLRLAIPPAFTHYRHGLFRGWGIHERHLQVGISLCSGVDDGAFRIRKLKLRFRLYPGTAAGLHP
jgi:hypothetical protein